MALLKDGSNESDLHYAKASAGYYLQPRVNDVVQMVLLGEGFESKETVWVGGKPAKGGDPKNPPKGAEVKTSYIRQVYNVKLDMVQELQLGLVAFGSFKNAEKLFRKTSPDGKMTDYSFVFAVEPPEKGSKANTYSFNKDEKVTPEMRKNIERALKVSAENALKAKARKEENEKSMDFPPAE